LGIDLSKIRFNFKTKIRYKKINWDSMFMLRKLSSSHPIWRVADK
jgi:hypothetical protein